MHEAGSSVSGRGGRTRTVRVPVAARAATAALALGAAVAVSLAAPPGVAAAGAAETSAAPAPAPASGAPVAGEWPELGRCASGELCLWFEPGFRGERRTYEMRSVRFGHCVRLPGGASAESFANRTGRPVTVYESPECAETSEFHTHPSGAWTPEGPYGVRAFKIWER